MDELWYYALVYIPVCFIPVIIATRKGRGGRGLFWLSLLITPVIGIIIAVALEPDTRKRDEFLSKRNGLKKCPYCAEFVKADAKVCRFCGRDIPERRLALPGGKRIVISQKRAPVTSLTGRRAREVAIEEASERRRFWKEHTADATGTSPRTRPPGRRDNSSGQELPVTPPPTDAPPYVQDYAKQE